MSLEFNALQCLDYAVPEFSGTPVSQKTALNFCDLTPPIESSDGKERKSYSARVSQSEATTGPQEEQLEPRQSKSKHRSDSDHTLLPTVVFVDKTIEESSPPHREDQQSNSKKYRSSHETTFLQSELEPIVKEKTTIATTTTAQSRFELTDTDELYANGTATKQPKEAPQVKEKLYADNTATEQPKLEFKAKEKLYSADNTPTEQPKLEFKAKEKLYSADAIPTEQPKLEFKARSEGSIGDSSQYVNTSLFSYEDKASRAGFIIKSAGADTAFEDKQPLKNYNRVFEKEPAVSFAVATGVDQQLTSRESFRKEDKPYEAPNLQKYEAVVFLPGRAIIANGSEMQQSQGQKYVKNAIPDNADRIVAAGYRSGDDWSFSIAPQIQSEYSTKQDIPSLLAKTYPEDRKAYSLHMNVQPNQPDTAMLPSTVYKEQSVFLPADNAKVPRLFVNNVDESPAGTQHYTTPVQKSLGLLSTTSDLNQAKLQVSISTVKDLTISVSNPFSMNSQTPDLRLSPNQDIAIRQTLEPRLNLNPGPTNVQTFDLRVTPNLNPINIQTMDWRLNPNPVPINIQTVESRLNPNPSPTNIQTVESRLNHTVGTTSSQAMELRVTPSTGPLPAVVMDKQPIELRLSANLHAGNNQAIEPVRVSISTSESGAAASNTFFAPPTRQGAETKSVGITSSDTTYFSRTIADVGSAAPIKQDNVLTTVRSLNAILIADHGSEHHAVSSIRTFGPANQPVSQLQSGEQILFVQLKQERTNSLDQTGKETPTSRRSPDQIPVPTDKTQPIFSAQQSIRQTDENSEVLHIAGRLNSSQGNIIESPPGSSAQGGGSNAINAECDLEDEDSEVELDDDATASPINQVLELPNLRNIAGIADILKFIDKATGCEDNANQTANSEQEPILPQYRTRYRIRDNDTLESIALAKLKDPRFADLLITINRAEIDYIEKDNQRVAVVYPGQVIWMPSAEEVAIFKKHFFSQKKQLRTQLSSSGNATPVLLIDCSPSSTPNQDVKPLAHELHSKPSPAMTRVLELIDTSNQDLHDAKSRIPLIINSLPVPMFIMNTDGTIESANPHAIQIFGYQTNEIVSHNVTKLLSAHTDDASTRLPEKLKEQWVNKVLELQAIKSNGTNFPVEVSITKFFDEGKERLLIIALDVSERSEFERLKQDLVADVSHDIKTPLTSLQCALSQLRADTIGTINEKGQDTLNHAEFELTRLINLIDGLLDVEKMQNGKMQLDRNILDARTLVSNSVNSVAYLANKCNITISVPSVTFDIWGDDSKLTQVIINLLSNAIKFSAEGASIIVSYEELIDGAMFKVIDSGIGIDPLHHGMIFDRFQQVHNSDKPNKGGKGLGLAICKRIVEGHGGTIGVDSEKGKGSTFWFKIQQPGCDDNHFSVEYNPQLGNRLHECENHQT